MTTILDPNNLEQIQQFCSRARQAPMPSQENHDVFASLLHLNRNRGPNMPQSTQIMLEDALYFMTFGHERPPMKVIEAMWAAEKKAEREGRSELKINEAMFDAKRDTEILLEKGDI